MIQLSLLAKTFEERGRASKNVCVLRHGERMQNVPDICELPVSPEHGEYYVFNKSHDGPGDNYTFLHLLYQCEYGYGIVGDDKINCSRGVWSDVLPTCISGCRLNYDADVHYLCKKWRSKEFSEEFCNVYIPNGEEVLPVCDTPYYRSDKDLPPMKCVDGNWNYTPACLPECGVNISKKKIPKHLWVHLRTPDGRVSRGRSARSKEFPWHVGIYNKMYKPYMQICGGSIISAEVVVTAAHCFWKDVEGLEPSRRFAVAAGKLYRRWTAPSDSKAQFRDVNNIVIPKRFRGGLTNFQDDIAIVYLSKPLSFNEYVWPVCFDFDWKLDQSQLTAGNLGKLYILFSDFDRGPYRNGRRYLALVNIRSWVIRDLNGRRYGTKNLLLPHASSHRGCDSNGSKREGLEEFSWKGLPLGNLLCIGIIFRRDSWGS
ncbi:Modular serine protease [Eumeta japonica]|uniref:Modular serine protease n=1 Tax=Eumeta variegata TaxID=151549 RepID=A0A4C2A9E9_EUMVA|nr:Modular serine protease [Eumeta japonica]